MTPTYQLHCGDSLKVLRTLPAQSVHCAVTSPPYLNLRDYGAAGQIGLERSLDAYVARLVEVFREVRRVLRSDGSLWLNLGDSYARETRNGLKKKDLCGVPWEVALALRRDGWFLRSDVIWEKPNCLPESVGDRPTKSHEYLFLLTKSSRYYYDADAIREPVQPSTIRRYRDPVSRRTGKYAGADPLISRMNPKTDTDEQKRKIILRGRNKRTVWRVGVGRFEGAHFATFPTRLITPCILASCPPGGTVLDPFSGAGTTGVAALEAGRNYVGVELNPEYVGMSRKRLEGIG